MKIITVKPQKSSHPVTVIDCFVDKGYLQGPGGSLPDVDIDYQSNRRQDVKTYIEQRYNQAHPGITKQRVFSAGTYTTLKVKAVIKDVARTMRIPPQTVNYITAIFDDDKCDYTGVFKLAAENSKIASFIRKYPQLFEDIRTLMFQPRSSSIHASALLVTPDQKDGVDCECFDFTPIKEVDGMLVSEFDGYQLDELGLLKNDCLATKELSKLHQTFDICKNEYGSDVTFEKVATGMLDDPKAYSLLANGYTQNVFQFSSKGMTRFLVDLKPNCINDLIAANALFRPATLENGSANIYLDCKSNPESQPVYLWGTYEALKDTYGEIVYQEQVAQIVRKVGGFSLGDGVNLVKYISKKKMDKIQAMKDKFMTGAAKNGCPPEDAVEIWNQIEACGSYLFNRSHATAYAVTAYCGAWLKANYPTAFYTVALEWADDDELVSLMSEMEICSETKVVPPDINVSTDVFYTDYSTNSIFWSLTRIKMCGLKAVQWIVSERHKNGDFIGIENFIDRIFKYKLKQYQYWDDPDNEEEAQRCPVNARHILNLILAGCFDYVERVGSIIERYAILSKAAEKLGFEIKEKDVPRDMIDKHYFWSQKQIQVSGLGSIDYKRIYDTSQTKELLKKRVSYRTIRDILEFEMEEKKVVLCATIVEMEEKKFRSKKTGLEECFCKLLLQQNNDTCECILWQEEYLMHQHKLKDALNKIIVVSGVVKYSDYNKTNNLQLNKNSNLEII